MSENTIKDGTGNAYGLEINKQNKAQTLAVSETIAAHHAFSGEAYNINTGTFSLTGASKSALLYLKNNEDEPLIVTALFYLIGSNTGGTGDHLIQVERNPTGGTLVSGGAAFTAVNRDFGSSNTLSADLIKTDTENQTLTGGVVAIESIFSGEGRQVLTVGAIVLRKGNSIGVTITPKPSTSAMDIQIALSVYRATELT